jgi:hypothetical protein
MRNRIVSAVAAAGLLGLIGGTVAANAGTDITSPETITTVGTTVKDKSIDVGRQGPSVGDTFATTVDIKSTTGVDLGTERTQCTLGTGRVAICTGAFDITGRGEIVGTGTVNFGSESLDFDVPITGGTGDFANVRGVAHVHLTENGETDTLDLLP